MRHFTRQSVLLALAPLIVLLAAASSEAAIRGNLRMGNTNNIRAPIAPTTRLPPGFFPRGYGRGPLDWGRWNYNSSLLPGYAYYGYYTPYVRFPYAGITTPYYGGYMNPGFTTPYAAVPMTPYLGGYAAPAYPSGYTTPSYGFPYPGYETPVTYSPYNGTLSSTSAASGTAGGSTPAAQVSGAKQGADTKTSQGSATREAGKVLTATGIPNDGGQLSYPLGLQVLQPQIENFQLLDQIETLFHLMATQQTAGQVDANLVRETTTALDRLQTMLHARQSNMMADVYAQGQQFLDKLRHGLKALEPKAVPAS